jgi:hypothetical protein
MRKKEPVLRTGQSLDFFLLLLFSPFKGEKKEERRRLCVFGLVSACIWGLQGHAAETDPKTSPQSLESQHAFKAWDSRLWTGSNGLA